MVSRVGPGSVYGVLGVAMMLLLSACTDDALVLGEKHTSRSDFPDASDTHDASEWLADAGHDIAPLKARFQANGRLNIVRIETPCMTECVDVTVVVEGGVPPYDVVWDDGKIGATQRLCPERSRTPSVAVSDSRPGGGGTLSLGFNALYARECDPNQPGFLTCFLPERRQVECAGKRRDVFDLGPSDQPGALSVELVCRPANALLVDATFSESPCREEAPVSGTQLGLTSGPQQSRGSFSLNTPTGQFLTFGGISGVGLPWIEDSIEVDWIEVCAQTTH